MKRLLHSVTLTLLFFVFACQQEADVGGGANPVDTLSYTYNTINKTAGDCQLSCLQIRLKILLMEDAETIQRQVDSLMLNIGANGYQSLDHYVDESMEEYARLMEEIPSYDMPWELERMAIVNFNKGGYIGVSISDYSFTGGAHPNNHHFHRLFTADDGRMLSWSALIDDESAFLVYAESVFRINKSINEDASLEAEGYWFEADQFYLPDNFTVDDKGLHFFYNTYEVAPYSEGAIVLSFSWEESEPFLAKGIAFE